MNKLSVLLMLSDKFSKCHEDKGLSMGGSEAGYLVLVRSQRVRVLGANEGDARKITGDPCFPERY